MPRRPSDPNYVEHAIRRRGDGYEVRVGNQSRTTRTLREARAKRTQLELDRSQQLDHKASRETLGTYLQHWLAHIETNRAAGTYHAWAPAIRLRILSHPIARIRLTELRPQDVDHWLTSLAHATQFRRTKTGTTSTTKPLSRRSQEKCWEAFAAAIHDARDKRLIQHDPLIGVDPPHGHAYHPTIWTPGQTQTFALHCAANPTTRTDALLFVLYLACRASGACNAQLHDLNIEAAAILIREGKTPDSWAEVAAIPEALELFSRAHTRNQTESTYWQEAHRTGPNYLFRQANGAPLTPTILLNTLHTTAATLGLPRIRTHDLRHYAGTQAKRAHIPDVDSARLLRHSSPNTTRLTYQHVNSADLHLAANAVADSWRAHDTITCPYCHGTGTLPKTSLAGTA